MMFSISRSIAMLTAVTLFSACTETTDELLPQNAQPLAQNDPITNESSPAQAQEINSALLDGTWEVVLLIDEGENETADVANFYFTFNDDGSVTANSTSEPVETITGSYTVFFDDGQTELTMTFPVPGPLDDLTDDWYFVSGTTTQLVWEDNSDTPPSALTLQQVSNGNGGGNGGGGDQGGGNNTGDQTEAVTNALLNGAWIVALLVDDAEDETTEFANFTLTFAADGTVTATHASDSSLNTTGTFSVFFDDNRTELEMNFSNPDFDDLSDDWYFISSTETTLVFEDDEAELLNALTLQLQ
jgi:hypothetical protein